MNIKTKTPPHTENPTEPKTGFFGKLVSRLDDSMRRAAEKKSAQGCCGPRDPNDKNGPAQGGKCC
jgi:hypothetical protein